MHWVSLWQRIVQNPGVPGRRTKHPSCAGAQSDVALQGEYRCCGDSILFWVAQEANKSRKR